MPSIKAQNSILIDTNIVIRYIADGDDYLINLIKHEKEIYLPLPVVFEIVFVLEKIYKIGRETINNYLISILSNSNVISEKETVYKIMDLFMNNKKLSIIDCYLIVYGENKNAKLITYDKDLNKKNH